MANLFERLLHQGSHRGNHIAVWRGRGADGGVATTYAELAAAARRFAEAFRRQAGEARILPLFMPKSAECIAAMMGAIGAGKAFTCLNRKLRTPQIGAILQALGPTLGLTDGPGVMTLSGGAAPGSPISSARWWVVRDEGFIKPHEKAVEKMRAAGPVEYWTGAGSEGGVDLPSLADDPQRCGCCLFTSGSTGTPKGVLIAESDLRARADAEVQWFGLGPDDVLLSILPFSFDVGLNQLLTALTTGCTLVLLDSWLPADILRTAAALKVTGISAVPAIWADMLKAGMSFDTAGAHASLRYITVSGGDLAPQQLGRLASLAPGAGIYKTYGQTEAFRASSLHPSEFHSRPGSVGRPFGGARVYVVREDNTLCGPEEEGQIVHTGLGVMLGYLDGQDSQNKLRPNPFLGPQDPNPFAIFTGDEGYLDRAGYLYVKGRRDAMLKVAGNRIYPKEIASQVLAIEQVAEAEVVGVKGSDGETWLSAFVVLVAGATMNGPQIRRELMGRLPSYMVPRDVVVLESMPRTASGKPDRPALTEQAMRLLSGPAAAGKAVGASLP